MIPVRSAPMPLLSSKPRASGDDPTRMIGASGACLVNPARAGMIHTQVRERFMPVGKPRASGDDPTEHLTRCGSRR